MAEVLEGDLNADGVVNFKDEEIAALNKRKQDLADAKAAAIAKKVAGTLPQGPQLGLTPLQERQQAKRALDNANAAIRRDVDAREVVVDPPEGDSVLGFELGDADAPTGAFERRMQEALGENINRVRNQSTDSNND